MSIQLSAGNLIAWAIAYLLICAAILLHLNVNAHGKYSLILLTLAAFVLRISAAFLDPFLNMWDEVFHAVAAKNMMDHPFTPMLHREPAMPISDHWPHQHIWLHKPPFFLWLIALSMKFFGTEVWAVRIPSAILTTALVPITWRMGTILRNERVGFISAILVGFSYLLIELTAGSINTDHNDAIFIALVGFSIWSLLEYLKKPRWQWAAAIGLFCAAAILTKWYIGLLAFLPFGLIVLQRKFDHRTFLHFLLAISIASLFVGAWLWHIWTWFPTEAAYEVKFKSQHFSYPIDGHRGTWMFHLEAIDDLVPPFTWWIIVPAFILLIVQVKDRSHRIILLSIFLAIHIFFMIAQTKMLCYTMVLLPFYLIAITNTIGLCIDRIRSIRLKRWIFPIGMIIILILTLDPVRIVKRHSLPEKLKEQLGWRRQFMEAIPVMEKLAEKLGEPQTTAIFNMPSNHFLQFMFDHGHNTWDKMPTEEDAARLIEKGYSVYAIQDGRPIGEFPPNEIVIPDSVLQFPRHSRL